jgi:hypothetical protein
MTNEEKALTCMAVMEGCKHGITVLMAIGKVVPKLILEDKLEDEEINRTLEGIQEIISSINEFVPHESEEDDEED